MHDSFSSRSTVHVRRSLFIRLTFPTLVSSGGELLWWSRIVCTTKMLASAILYNNISVFYTCLTCVHVEPAQPTPSTAPPLQCETHPAQRPSLSFHCCRESADTGLVVLKVVRVTGAATYSGNPKDQLMMCAPLFPHSTP